MTPYFCWLSLPSPKDPTFWWNVDPLITSHPKTPYFLHSAATGSYFLFQFLRQIDHFCHFCHFFFQIPAFKALTERSEVTFSPSAPQFWTKIWLLTQWPSFLRLCSHQMPQTLEVWALHPYPFDIGVPPRGADYATGSYAHQMCSFIPLL